MLPGYRILAEVGVGGWGHVRERQGWAFPEQARRALAGEVQAFQMERMLAGAQAERAAIIAHGVSGRAADLGKGRAGLGPVSYTHLDVYKRQSLLRAAKGKTVVSVAHALRFEHQAV